MKTRFCPSPTGHMHVGNARTALFSALFAKSSQGGFLLRIEDTDLSRSTTEYAEQLMDDLRWLGLVWQEGPGVGGDAGPYQQSHRLSLYDVHYQSLLDKKIAYPCFCSDAELAINRKVQLASGRPPRYPGTCHDLSEEQIAAKKAEGLEPVLRFRVPQNEIVEFEDLVKGKQSFNSSDIGDFIIQRADKTSPFMFCNALDDSMMGVTHVLRGEDHLTNTPRQLMILKALGMPEPTYGHISLIYGKDGAPLSKRNGSRSVLDLKSDGYLAIAVVNYLARLGHYYADERFMTLDELASKFDPSHLATSPAKFDPSQLNFWQKEAVMSLSDEAFADWIGEEPMVPVAEKADFVSVVRPNVLFPHDAKAWANIFYAEQLEYESKHIDVFKEAGAEFFKVAKALIEKEGPDFDALSRGLKEQLGVSGKALFLPLRLVWTNQHQGPEMKHILRLIGKDRAMARFDRAFQLTQG